MFTLINIDTYDSSLISKKPWWIKMKSSIENTLKLPSYHLRIIKKNIQGQLMSQNYFGRRKQILLTGLSGSLKSRKVNSLIKFQ